MMVSGLPDEDFNPLPTSASGGRGPVAGIAQQGRGVVPVHRTVPLAASESPGSACVPRRPRRIFGGCALHGYAGREGLVVWTGWE